MGGSLIGCKKKLDRADRHLQEIEGAVTADLLDAYTVETQFNTEMNKWVYVITNVTHPPVELGVIVGDFVHNLRSSLDHLVYQLVEVAGGDHSVKSSFPIFADSARYRDESSGRKCLRQIDPARGAKIDATYLGEIDALQPHAAGRGGASDPLWLLSELSNIDKHRILHAGIVAVALGVIVLKSPDMPGRELTRLKISQKRALAVEEGAILEVLNGFPRDKNPDEYFDLKRTSDVHFGDGSQDIKGRPVLETLRLIREDVHRNVFPKFEPAFR